MSNYSAVPLLKCFLNKETRARLYSIDEERNRYSPLLCESDVGAPCAAGGCIVDTCASCIVAVCAGSEPRCPEMVTAGPWRALLIVVGTWAIWAMVPDTWCMPPGAWCNVVGTCPIPPGICGICARSWWLAAAYWQVVSGIGEWVMLPACLRRRALRLLNHTWNGVRNLRFSRGSLAKSRERISR